MSLPKELIRRIEGEFRKRDPEIVDFAIEEIVEISGGWESPIYSFRVRFQKGKNRFERGQVIRFYQGEGSHVQARKDFQIMTRVNQFGIPTPGLDFLILDEEGPQDAYLLMEKIEGQSAARLIRAGQDQQGEVLKRLAAYQARLHEIDWQQIWQPEDANEVPQQDFVLGRMGKLKQTIAQNQSSDFDCNLAWLEERIPNEGGANLSLLHNDYHPENALLRSEDGALFLIDWGFAELGDARMDLAWTLLQVSLMLGSTAKEDYLAAYEDVRGQAVEHLAFFEVLKFTERMLTIAQWLQPDFEIPIRKISKAALHGSYKIHVINVYNRLKDITGCEIPLIEAL